MKTVLVTGGAGFIGSNFVLQTVKTSEDRVVNLDALTYAGNLDNLLSIDSNPNHVFVRGNILDRTLVDSLLVTHAVTHIVHFAAESHVDRSIDGPGDFVRTNVLGTHELLEAALAYFLKLGDAQKRAFRFLHVSTDEVFGSLAPTCFSSEEARYAPSSPYAASKAAADHLVRAYGKTYDLPILITHSCNTYGPLQFPEKLVPLVIMNALEGRGLPIYGDGRNVRDWVYVEDHCAAIRRVLETGRPGESYLIGGRSERANIDVVRAICAILDELVPAASNPRLSGKKTYDELMTFVRDRPGHDLRYAVDCAKLERELGWTASHTFSHGMRKTIRWYIENRTWCDHALSAAYRCERLGLSRIDGAR